MTDQPAHPVVEDLAPHELRLTDYDERHYRTYARLHEAVLAGIDWREGARSILNRDPIAEPDSTQGCWDSHVARAQWVATHGLAELVADLRRAEDTTR